MYPELPLEWQAELASRFAKVENGGLLRSKEELEVDLK